MNTPTDAASTALMMAAMMLPSAAPFAVAFGRARGWAPVALVAAAYVAVWIAVGVPLAMLAGTFGMAVPALLAIGFAVAYTLSPLGRAGRARCLAMCRSVSASRPAVAEGAAYGVSCVLCTAGVMLAVLTLGMSDVRLMVLAMVAVTVIKLPVGGYPRYGEGAPGGR
jgi:predicted metal-binding membrane protein